MINLALFMACRNDQLSEALNLLQDHFTPSRSDTLAAISRDFGSQGF